MSGNCAVALKENASDAVRKEMARVPLLLQRWVAADCRVGSRAALVVVNNAILDGAEHGLSGDARSNRERQDPTLHVRTGRGRRSDARCFRTNAGCGAWLALND